LFSAIIRRLAATAAPPVLSLVFTINTLIAAKVLQVLQKTKENE